MDKLCKDCKFRLTQNNNDWAFCNCEFNNYKNLFRAWLKREEFYVSQPQIQYAAYDRVMSKIDKGKYKENIKIEKEKRLKGESICFSCMLVQSIYNGSCPYKELKRGISK